MAPNNPKGFVGRSLGAPGLKATVRVGEGAIREVAAYLLDKDGYVPTLFVATKIFPVFRAQQEEGGPLGLKIVKRLVAPECCDGCVAPCDAACSVLEHAIREDVHMKGA